MPGRPVRMLFGGAFVAVAVAVTAAVGVADDSGGTTTGEACEDVRFGDRSLRLGDCGDDVMTLNWVMKSKPYASGLQLKQEFKDPTDAAVREFQERAGLDENGVVNNRTREELKRTMTRKSASWYGPGFWGNQTACGQKLKHRTVGVAHKKLPCGTKVAFNKGGRWLRTRVIDRGPYVQGRTWDLTQRAAEALGMEYTESVRSAVIVKPGKDTDKGNE